MILQDDTDTVWASCVHYLAQNKCKKHKLHKIVVWLNDTKRKNNNCGSNS